MSVYDTIRIDKLLHSVERLSKQVASLETKLENLKRNPIYCTCIACKSKEIKEDEQRYPETTQ